MTLVIHKNNRIFGCRKNQTKLSGGLAVEPEAFSWLQFRTFDSPQRLSAEFGLRLAPSQPQQKSCSQPAHGTRSQFAASPPLGPSFRLPPGQCPQRPQEPESGGHHFNPDLDASFSFWPVELPAGQPQFTFHKADAVLDTETLVIDRFSLLRSRQPFLHRHED